MRRRLLRTVIALAASGGLVACGGDDRSTGATPDASFTTVTPAQIAPRAAAGEVLLVDVREDDEWQAGHAGDAQHVPLAEVSGRLDRLRTEAAGRPIAFICRSGNRSGQAARAAVDAGLTQVINVDGGMGAWLAAGLPIVPADGRVL
ncbi:rhodanese-like domain-containing protein [Paraconexibacter algicola]|uniref:Rhodanese domain-containing protein n=1 Tax=Paraconexibacter algicola TaxID=2133960 RepID=A0A2T4UKD4_9ACTN|nr:rhodanese-like domain-containing protein [Paraconexibacter algicola]PTL59712.1 hypothetical protein C7Y72_08630 [Paraconexibacter algicola]